MNDNFISITESDSIAPPIVDVPISDNALPSTVVLPTDIPVEPAEPNIMPDDDAIDSESLPTDSENKEEIEKDNTESQAPVIDAEPSVSSNDIENGESTIEIPLGSVSSNNIVVSVSGNGFSDILSNSVSANALNETLVDQNKEMLTILKDQNIYIKSVMVTLSALLFFILISWAVNLIKVSVRGFAGYGKDK